MKKIRTIVGEAYIDASPDCDGDWAAEVLSVLFTPTQHNPGLRQAISLDLSEFKNPAGETVIDVIGRLFWEQVIAMIKEQEEEERIFALAN